MRKAKNLNHLASQHLNKRKTESPTQHLKNQLLQNNGGANSAPSYTLPSEPEPPEKEESMEQWNSPGDPDIVQSGGSDYEVNTEMYPDQMEDEQFYHGSQVILSF